ncbi:MAG TPA: SUKH-4 family immunity protein [Myxococcaceae bacterium]|jgi:hypothetical protein
MPKASDFLNVSQVPSPSLAKLVGPGPLKHSEALKAVLQHVMQNKLWLVPGQLIRPDAALREALACSDQIHMLELPRIVLGQLKPASKEVAAIKAKHLEESRAEPLSARWLEGDEFEEPCVAFDEAALEGLELDERTRSFLLRVGLPESAAPFLDFDAEREGAPLEELADRTGREEDRGLRILGIYGDGEEQDQVVCLDERQGGRVVLRDPAKDTAPVLMNSGVHELLECLMVYRDLLRTRTDREEDEEPRIPRRLHAKAAQGFKARDPRAFQPGTFWFMQTGGSDRAPPEAASRQKTAPRKAPPKKATSKKKAAPKKKPSRPRR